MLSQNHFYYQMLKKYVVAFQHIISDIHVIRSDSFGVPQKDITVPVTYSTKSKLYNYLTRNVNLGDKVSTILPRISFIINGMQFDPTRKKSNLGEIRVTIDDEDETFIYSGNPYNFNIDMSVWTKYVDDLQQIIEQIAALFRPDVMLTVNEIPEFDIKKNIPTELNDIQIDIENEYEDTDRVVIANLNFTLKGYVYPPVNNSKVIRHIYARMGKLPNYNIEETVKIDWDELTDVISTEIVDGEYPTP